MKLIKRLSHDIDRGIKVIFQGEGKEPVSGNLYLVMPEKEAFEVVLPDDRRTEIHLNEVEQIEINAQDCSVHYRLI